MRKVFKYDMAVTDFIVLPPGKLVHAEPNILDGPGNLLFWVEHEYIDNEPTVPVGKDLHLQIVGTGHHIVDGGYHLLSVRDLPFYWHIYDVTQAVKPHG